MRRVRLRRAVEGGLYEHAQPYIRAALMMGVFSCICSGGLWGRLGLQCRILVGVIVSFLGVNRTHLIIVINIFISLYQFYRYYPFYRIQIIRIEHNRLSSSAFHELLSNNITIRWVINFLRHLNLIFISRCDKNKKRAIKKISRVRCPVRCPANRSSKQGPGG